MRQTRRFSAIAEYEKLGPLPGRIEGGLRLRTGMRKKSDPARPIVSIVTVVCNGTDFLERTIRSVVEQTYANIEYIIIDGGSTDGTLDIVRKYDDKIDYWVSEFDSGIYDAMNKGIGLSLGEWILFMNSGDFFYGKNTMEKVMSGALPDADLIYGHSIKDFGSFNRFQPAGELRDLWKSTIFWHQCLFTKTELLKKNPFNTHNALTADYEFTVKMAKEGRLFYKSDVVVAVVSAGGISDINRIKAIRSRWGVARKYYGERYIDLYYPLLIVETAVKSALKKILPGRIVAFLLKHKKSSV